MGMSNKQHDLDERIWAAVYERAYEPGRYEFSSEDAASDFVGALFESMGDDVGNAASSWLSESGTWVVGVRA